MARPDNLHALDFVAVDPDVDWGPVRATCSKCGPLPGSYQSQSAAYWQHDGKGERVRPETPSRRIEQNSICR